MRFISSHRSLLLRVIHGEIRARYAGSLLGASWVFFAPALLLSVYALIYVKIFRTTVPDLSTAGYVLFIFSGLVPFLAMSESITSSLGAVLNNKAILSNTVYPIDLTPVTAVVVSQGIMAVGFVIIIIGDLIFGYLTPFILLLPVIWFFQILALTGLAWILSILNVLLRDVQNVVGVVLLLLLISAPIAYTPSQVPAQLDLLILLNPVAWFITAYQDIAVLGFSPHLNHWAGLIGFSVGTFVVGSWVFDRVKPIVADHV